MSQLPTMKSRCYEYVFYIISVLFDAACCWARQLNRLSASVMTVIVLMALNCCEGHPDALPQQDCPPVPLPNQPWVTPI